MSRQFRKTWLEINLSNIHQNLLKMKEHVYPKKIIPVIKADAYGHGAKMVAQYLIEWGEVDFFAVSLLEEALELRDLNPDIDILVMGVVDEFALPTLSEKNITFTVSQEQLYKKVLDSGLPLKFHLKYDSGMNRLGFKSPTKIRKIADDAMTHDHLNLTGIYTHLATADSDEDYVKMQAKRFKQIVKSLLIRPKMVHISNTPGLLRYENLFDFTTHARAGIGLFGDTVGYDGIKLKSTFILKSRISEIKELSPGEKLGYNLTYEAKEQEKIAILPIGYADGLIRKNQGGHVSTLGRRYEIVGRICMDQTFVKVDDYVRLGDTVTVMGDDIVSVKDVADRLDTITYEIFTQISNRVHRIYYDD